MESSDYKKFDCPMIWPEPNKKLAATTQGSRRTWIPQLKAPGIYELPNLGKQKEQQNQSLDKEHFTENSIEPIT
ncbi:MAG TPA: hypothetical protein VFW25_14880 [Silvibacterium sp.]|nr:hypothetical protein [Silvibacterium sp.]